jgi:hypothetical protein
MLSVLLMGCAGASSGTIAEATAAAPAVPPPAAPAAASPPAATVATASPASTSAPAEPAVKKKDKKDKKGKVKISSLFSSKPAQMGTMQPDGTYKLSDAELSLNCKKLTGRTFVRILQIRDHELSQKSSPIAQGAQQVVSPVFGGSSYGANPEADYRRDRAIVEAYNQRLGEKGCKVFDLVKELQPKPAGESPTLVKR